MYEREPLDSAEVDSETLDDLQFQEDLAVDAADAFLHGLQIPFPAADPGLSAPLAPADVHHDPGQSTGTNHPHDDAGMSVGTPHGLDTVAGISHDPVFAVHDILGAGAHDSGAQPHVDVGAFHH
jgi:hypothetical protein